MALLEVKGLQKNFGDLKVLKDVNIKVEEGEVLVLIGPSGSGESTLLRCLNLLETPTGGDIIFENKSILEKKFDVKKYRQKVGMCFQRFNLFPFMTVLDNVTFAPKLILKKDKEEAKKVALEECVDIYFFNFHLVLPPLQPSGISFPLNLLLTKPLFIHI